MSSEWKDARTHREPKWPLMGYAPGKYLGRCRDCGEMLWDVDKRATQCLPCAIDCANSALDNQKAQITELRTERDTLRNAFQIVGTLPPARDAASGE